MSGMAHYRPSLAQLRAKRRKELLPDELTKEAFAPQFEQLMLNKSCQSISGPEEKTESFNKVQGVRTTSERNSGLQPESSSVSRRYRELLSNYRYSKRG